MVGFAPSLRAICVLMLVGCHQTISLGNDLRSSAGVETAADGTDAVSTSDEEPSSAAETSGSGDAGGEASTHATSDPSGSTSDATGTTGGLCSPDPRDSACLSCVKTLCCPEAQSCNADPDCDCMLECVSESMPSECAQACEPNGAASALATCIATACPGACG